MTPLCGLTGCRANSSASLNSWCLFQPKWQPVCSFFNTKGILVCWAKVIGLLSSYWTKIQMLLKLQKPVFGLFVLNLLNVLVNSVSCYIPGNSWRTSTCILLVYSNSSVWFRSKTVTWWPPSWFWSWMTSCGCWQTLSSKLWCSMPSPSVRLWRSLHSRGKAWPQKTRYQSVTFSTHRERLSYFLTFFSPLSVTLPIFPISSSSSCSCSNCVWMSHGVIFSPHACQNPIWCPICAHSMSFTVAF